MKKIHLEEYRRIQNPKGNIYKFMETCKFPKHLKGEIYMSQIKFNEIKAWRRHKLYEAIFIVVSGIVQLKCMNKDKNLLCFGLGTTDPRGIFSTTINLEKKFGSKS